MKIEDFAKPAGAAGLTARGDRLRPFAGLAAPAWNLPISHFSATQLQMLEICPEQYRQRYILGKKEPPGQALVVGRLTHGGVEFGLDTKIVTGDDPHLDDMLVHYHDVVWPQTMEGYGGPGEVIWDDDPETVRHKAAQMVRAYHPTISRLQPESVEQEFELELGLQVPVIGFIDVMQANGRPSIDLKTSEKRRSDLRPDWRVQARVYQLAVPSPVDFHVITKAKLPAVVTGLEETGLVEAYSESHVEQVRRRLGQALSALEHFYLTYGPDETWPTRGIHHDWRCKWCAWQSICPEWAT
jgi:hypothetical protein